jgi:hypothetical protein
LRRLPEVSISINRRDARESGGVCSKAAQGCISVSGLGPCDHGNSGASGATAFGINNSWIERT